VRNRKEALSKTYGLSLEQVEWAYALSVTLVDFDSLSVDRQNSVLETLCGVSKDTDGNGFSMLSHLWNDVSPLNPETVNWLLKGLSQADASQVFFACLEHFQTEDFERAQLEAQQDGDRYYTSLEESEDFADVDPSVDPLSNWIPETVETGRLIIRIQDPLRDAYHYRTLGGTIDRVLHDTSMENKVLTKWIDEHANHDEPLAMLCINWKTTTEAGQEKTVRCSHASANLGVTSMPCVFHHVVTQEASMECSGSHRNTLQTGGINLETRTVTSDSQHLEHWCIELCMLRGEGTPMYWKLQNVVSQQLYGKGHRGGFVSLDSNIYVQFVDAQNRRLLGTPSTLPPIAVTQLNEHTVGNRKSSHLNTWLADSPIDFSKHVIHNQASAEPVFNSTPSIEQRHSITTDNKGHGYTLHGLFFAELRSKAWQEDTSQRVDLWYQNRVESIVTGSIFWNGNQLDLLESGQLRWTKMDTDVEIELKPTQSNQISTHTETLTTSSSELETVRIHHTRRTHQYNGPSYT